MGKYVASEKYICSIFPGPMPEVRMGHGPTPNPRDGNLTVYQLKPVKKGDKPFVLKVSDSFEHPVDALKTAEQGRTIYDTNLVTCEEITNALLRHWVGNMVGLPHGALPGIMEIISEVPKQAELRQLEEQQQAYMEYMFMEGERIARDKSVDQISPPMKLAAEHLGRERLWSHPAQSLKTVSCEHCRQQIPDDATLCHHCGGRQEAVIAAREAKKAKQQAQQPQAELAAAK